MNNQIKLLRSHIDRLINQVESFPESEDKNAEIFENWVNELNAAIQILPKVGDRCFIAFPTFSFPRPFYAPSGQTINERGYQALRYFLDSVKPMLTIPVV